MRAFPFPFAVARLLVIGIALHALAGCAAFQGSTSAPSVTTRPATQPANKQADQNTTEDAAIADSAQSTAERLAKAMTRSRSAPPRSRGANQPSATQPRRIHWRNAARRSRPKPQPREATPDRPAQAKPETSDAAKAETQQQQQPPTTQPQHKPLRDQPRDALIDELTTRLQQSDRPPMQKAISAIGLGLMNQAPEPKPSLLQTLPRQKRDQVDRLYALNKSLAGKLLDGSTRLSQREVNQQVNALFQDQPVTIEKVDLCKSVEGFGVYEPFADHRFLSDKQQKMIVYVELDHFKRQKVDGRFEVKLEQEIVLFNESDGLAVWSREPATILDRSRNRRNDFFTLQLITLPASLNVGKYRLKVRITDVHGGAVDETTVPLELVADPAIAQKRQNPGPK
jgi:hypothetical protein